MASRPSHSSVLAFSQSRALCQEEAKKKEAVKKQKQSRMAWIKRGTKVGFIDAEGNCVPGKVATVYNAEVSLQTVSLCSHPSRATSLSAITVNLIVPLTRRVVD